MLKDSLRNGISIISVEEMVTTNGDEKILICDFCDRPVQFTVTMEFKGKETSAWICGECPESKEILTNPRGGGGC